MTSRRDYLPVCVPVMKLPSVNASGYMYSLKWQIYDVAQLTLSWTQIIKYESYYHFDRKK